MKDDLRHVAHDWVKHQRPGQPNIRVRGQAEDVCSLRNDYFNSKQRGDDRRNSHPSQSSPHREYFKPTARLEKAQGRNTYNGYYGDR